MIACPYSFLRDLFNWVSNYSGGVCDQSPDYISWPPNEADKKLRIKLKFCQSGKKM